MKPAEEPSENLQAELVAGLNHARELFGTAQLEAAETAATRLLQQFPGDRRPAMLLGPILMRRGKIDEAADLARKGLRQHPEAVEFHRILARALLETDRLAEVVAATDASADILKTDADLCVYRCRALFGLRRYAEAEQLAARSMQQHPKDSRIALMRGRTLFQMGRHDSAYALALDAIKVTPDDHRIALLLCRSLFALGRFSEAGEAAARALAERPDDRQFGLIRCRALLRTGQTVAAKVQVEQLLKQRPNDPELLEVARQAAGGAAADDARDCAAEAEDADEPETSDGSEIEGGDAGEDRQTAATQPQPTQDQGSNEAARALTARLGQVRALMKAQRLEAAEEAAVALFEAHSSDQRVPLLLGDVLFRRKKLDEALQVAEDGIKAFPQSLPFRHLEARALLRNEAFAEAEQRTGASLVVFPMDCNLTVSRCRALFSLDRFEETEALAAKAAQVHGTDKRFDLLRCKALHELGQHDKVVEVGRAALEKHPEADDIALRLCRSLAALGRPKEVVETAEACLSRDPESRAFAQMLCDALLRCGAFKRANHETARFHRKHPEDPSFLRMRGTALSELGQGAEVRDLLGPVISRMSATAAPLLGTYVNALERVGDWDSIVKTIERYLENDKEVDTSVRIKLCMAYEWLGRPTDARRAYQEVEVQFEAQLPSDLPLALREAQKHSKAEIPNWQMPAPLIDCLWDLADQDRWDRATWIEMIKWGRGARQLLLWTNAMAIDRRSDVARMVSEPDFSQVRAAMSGKRSVLLAAAHLGPFAALIPALAGAEIPTCVLSGIQIPEERSYGSVYALSLNQSAIRAFRHLRDAVSAGHAILAPGDADRGLDAGDLGYRVEVFGREVEVPSLTPRIAFQYKLPSFFCQPIFRSDRIEIDVKPLPHREAGETRDSFAARWLQAYLDYYVDILLGDPRNLSVMGGPIRKAFVDQPQSSETGRKLPVKVDRARHRDK